MVAYVLAMPLIAAALMGCVLIWLAVRKRRVRYGSLLCVLAALVLVWLFCYMLELLLGGESQKRLMLNLQYFAIPYVMPVFLLYVLGFTNAKRPRWLMIALFAVPVISGIACWTNAWHGLYYTSLGVSLLGRMGALVISHNILYYIHAAYAGLVLVIGAIRLMSSFLRLHKLFLSQLVILMGSITLPLAANMAYMTLGMAFDLTPVALVASMYLFVWLLNDYAFCDVLPKTRTACIEAMDAALFQVDGDKTVLDMNQAACALLEKRSSEIFMRDLTALFAGLGTRLLFSGDEEFRITKGAADAYYAAHTSEAGGVALVQVHDVGELKRSEERHSYFANFDALTALPNRSLFYKLLQRELDHVKRYREELLILLIDIDGFHDINELYGYQAGDRLLLELTKRLNDSLRKIDTVARFGNDEFHVILPKLSSADAPSLIERLLASLSLPVKSTKATIEFTVSVGIARAPEDSVAPEELLACAKTALRGQAKTRNSYRMYTPELEGGLEHGGDIKYALENGEASCAFDPVVDEAGEARFLSGRVYMRRGKDELELFPGAALSALTPEAELRILHLLLAAHSDHSGGPRLLLELGPRHLLKQDFVQRFCQSLRQFGHDTQGFLLLVQPAALFQRNEDVRACLRTLKEAGAEFVLDSFEAGQTAAQLVFSHGIKYARLNKDLVSGVNERANYLLVEAAARLAQSAGVELHAVADGPAMEKLRKAGIRLIKEAETG